VAIASWFEEILKRNTSIVVELKASASTREERLHLLGKRVQVPTHANADSLFELADRLPLILTMIEEGQFKNEQDVVALYTPAEGNTLQPDMVNIINHWSRATKSDIKSVAVEMATAGR